MKNYKIKASFRVGGIPGGGMSDKEETHDMVLSQSNVNRVREWLAKHYGVGPHDVSVFSFEEVQ